jgi:type I restriction enzyme S subunit
MKTCSLSELYDGLFDGPHATPKPSDSGPIFLGIKNITEDGRLDLSTIRHISEDEYPKWTKRVTPKPGDIVFSYEATLHRYAIIPEGFRGCLGRRMALIRPNKDKVNTEYLFHYFFSNSWRDEVRKHILTGATVDRIPLTNVPNFEVTVHEKEEQDQIAKVISAYSDLIENNNRRITILEEMAQSLYREWFVKFRFPGHDQCQMVESPFGLIPEGWKYLTLGELVNFKRNSVKKGSLETPTPYMGLEHFPRKSFALSEWDLATEIGSSKLAFEKGDILFGKIRPYFHKVGVAQTKGLCSSDTFVLSTRESEHSNLVAMVTFSESFVAHAVQTSQGTKMPRANWDVLSEYSVPLPTNQLLTAFNGLVGPAIEQVRVLSSKNRNLKKQRDLLLPKLISGQIDLSLAEQATA